MTIGWFAPRRHPAPARCPRRGSRPAVIRWPARSGNAAEFQSAGRCRVAGGWRRPTGVANAAPFAGAALLALAILRARLRRPSAIPGQPPETAVEKPGKHVGRRRHASRAGPSRLADRRAGRQGTGGTDGGEFRRNDHAIRWGDARQGASISPLSPPRSLPPRRSIRCWCSPSSRRNRASRATPCRPANAQGLMQLMPDTARALRRARKPAQPGREHPRRHELSAAGFSPISKVDLSLALAAYNAGEGRPSSTMGGVSAVSGRPMLICARFRTPLPRRAPSDRPARGALRPQQWAGRGRGERHADNTGHRRGKAAML